ncbi:MAG: hypothetical protein ACRDP3_04010 [Streptomyces sp.]|uniref:hypothetical protein n=1 Tax=Streptomyces sp. TaxID=1931 RepID=UPI003D6B140B
MSEPIALPGPWRTVMQAAGYRCQCTGECGSAHKKGDGRCPREHDQHASKHRGPIHPAAAPADPTTPALAAARLPASRLRAWCPDCHDGARRASNRAARSQPDDAQGSLFAL